MTNPNPNLYALLIGIDCYLPNRLSNGTSYRNLGGSVRDINHVEEFLLRQPRKPTKIFKLTSSNPDFTELGEFPEPKEPESQLPTYKNIVAKFQELTETASSGDLVYIQYSGHGGRAITNYPQIKGDNGIDEGFVPVDIGTGEGQYLRDLELAMLMKKMVDKGLVVTLVIDCCHSGGTVRGEYADIRGLDTIDETDRPASNLVASTEELTQHWQSLTQGESEKSGTVTRKGTAVAGMLPEVEGYVVLAACRPSEYAFEYAFDSKNRNGALTYWLLDTLNQPMPGMTYKILHDRINAKIKTLFPQQTPMLMGEGERLVFGSEYVRTEYAVNIMQVEVEGKTTKVKFDAGQAQGLRKGAELAIYSFGSQIQEEERIAIAKITELGASDSWAIGEDIFKVFATVGNANFRWLELPPLDQPILPPEARGVTRSGGALDELLMSFAAEQPPTRNGNPVAFPSREWITTQFSVKVKGDGENKQVESIDPVDNPNPNQQLTSNPATPNHPSPSYSYSSKKLTKILILAANPRQDLRLASEIRDIREIIRSSPNREQFQLEQREALRPQDLQRALLEVQPRIVHFCGHGSGNQGLVLENNAGEQQLVTTVAISNLFKQFQNQVECVLLNACSSQTQAQSIVQHINYVIGMGRDILDDAAIAFTKGFYEALVYGRSIDSAYEFGCNNIQIEINRSKNYRTPNPVAVPEHLIPKLLKNSNPVEIYSPVEENTETPSPGNNNQTNHGGIQQYVIGSIGSTVQSGMQVSVGNDNQQSASKTYTSSPENNHQTNQGGIQQVISSDKMTGGMQASIGNNDQQSASKTYTSLVRYPCLNYPDITILNQQFRLLIKLLIEQPESNIKHILVEDNSNPDSLPEVEIVVRTAGSFDIQGDDYQLMQVQRYEDSSVEFILTPLKLGQQEIRVDFYQYDRRISTQRCNVFVKNSFHPHTKNIYSQKSISLELNTLAIAPPPDLEICVEIHNERTLNFSIHSSSRVADYHHTKVGQVNLQSLPLDKMQSVYKELSSKAARFSRDSSNRKGTSVTKNEYGNIERQFAVLGCQLWDELIPEKLKQEYWRFKSRIKSMLITSDEPWVPWEMIKPYRYDENGNRQDEPFWCQQFALSRWLSGQGSMVDKLPLGLTVSVAPTQVNLPAVQQELEFIKHLPNLRSGIVVLKPSSGYQEILDSLETAKFSILHFACHGMFDATLPNNSGISLSDGVLRPADVLVRFGGKRPRPLVFINACHGARSSFSFTGLGGWAQRLILGSHVGAFIGAMWEVNDELALKFAQHFYTRLLENNETIAEAFRQAREEVRRLAPYNSTWLAYSLYADPQGHFQDKLGNLNQEDVIQLIEYIGQLISVAVLPVDVKKKSLRYLEMAKDEVLEDKPDKEFAATNLKKIVDSLKKGSEVSNQSLCKNVEEILEKLDSWFD